MLELHRKTPSSYSTLTEAAEATLDQITLVVGWTGNYRGSTCVAPKRRIQPAKLNGEANIFPTFYDIKVYDRPTRRLLVADMHLTNYRIIITSACDDDEQVCIF